MRRQGWAILAVILAGGCVYSMRPRYTSVPLGSIRSLLRCGGCPAQLGGPSPPLIAAFTDGRNCSSSYYPRARDFAAITRDATDLTELGDSAVRQTGDSLLVIRANLPIASRWIPLWTSYDVRFKR